MRRIFPAILLVGLWALAFTPGCGGPAVGNGTCTSNDQCKDGEFCKDGACAGGCKNDADCPTGGLCQDGICKSDGCTDNTTCKDGKICKESKCVPCEKNLECGAGKVCVSGQCKEGDCTGPNDTSCPDGKLCKDFKCSACSDGECGQGELCVEGACKKGECKDNSACSNGQACIDLKCADCEKDEQCDSGSVCVSGKCKVGDCKDNSACKDGQVCKDNKCADCSVDTDCEKGQVCDNSTKRCRAGCINDSDCANNQKCDTNEKVCKGCLDRADCPTGQLCKESKCVGCQKTEECPKGTVCKNQLCISGCRDNGDCQDGKVCKDNKCTDCSDDAECNDAALVCDPGSKRCRKGCKADGDCPNGKFCDTTDSTCYECLKNENCPGGQICRQNKCVACSKDTDCTKPLICDDTKKVCRDGCRKDSECAAGKVCDTNTATCVECVDSTQCSGGKVCKNNTCSDCATDADCPNGKHCDPGNKLCHECVDNTHCANGTVCKSNKCTDCATDAECGTGKLCDATTKRCFTGTCRKHEDCTGTDICVNQQCVSCPKLNLSLTGSAEGVEGIPFSFTLQIPTGALPTGAKWTLGNGPTWTKVTRVSDTEARVDATAPSAGTFNATVEITIGKCTNQVKVPIKIWPKLESLVNPFLDGSNGKKAVELNTTIKGGKPPYSCGLSAGAGRGTLPRGISFGTDSRNIQTSGCTLTGTPTNANKPGIYGFLVEVQDAFGQQAFIPVSYKVGQCTDSNFSLTPGIGTLPVRKTGAAYSFKVKLKFDNYRNTSNQCTYNINLLMSLGPLSAGPNLGCASALPVCVDCSGNSFCVTGHNGTSCPTVITSEQDINVRTHPPIRTNFPKGPAFQSFEPLYRWRFNNDSTQFREKTCHFDILERD